MDEQKIDQEELNELDMIFADIGGNEGANELAKGDFEEIGDGTYSAEIQGAEYTHSKDDVPMIKMTFGIEGQNGKVWDYLMLGHKENDRKKVSAAVGRTITKLQQLGLMGDSVSDYIKQLPELEGKTLTLTIETTKSGFVNKHYQ